MRKNRRERPSFINTGIYHVYNRGVAKAPLFLREIDYLHFLDTLSFYREAQPASKLSLYNRDPLRKLLNSLPKQPLIEILAYCLMPNHFHLILRQLKDDGVSTYLRRLQNSYTRYFNVKHERVGTMFQGRFQAVAVSDDAQLLQLSRYIHLNPVVSRLVQKPEDYRWSSYSHYLKGKNQRLCQPTLVLALAGSSDSYHAFTEDYIEYAKTLFDLKHLLLED